MSVVAQELVRPACHVKLLDFWSARKLVWLEHGLDLSNEDDQRAFLARIEQDAHLVPDAATPADTAIEYLFVHKRLTVQEVSSALRLHPECTRERLIHLAKEAHDRLKRQPGVRSLEVGLAA